MNRPRPLPLTAESFRDVAALYPTGVVIVTAQADGFDHAMTASSFVTVSLDPLLVLVSVEQQTRFHDALIAPGTDGRGAGWAISILPAAAAAMASWFATKGRPLHGQFDRYGHERAPATGSIVFTDALATMELRTEQTVPVGDHTLVIGEVVAMAVSQANSEDSPDRGPLTYWARRYRNLRY